MILKNAYALLSTARTMTPVGIGPIGVDLMWEWCDRHELDNEITNHVVHILVLVDQETLRRARAARGA